MCGIVGYIGKRQAQAILLDSLKRLEYRGYDSAGIAVLDSNKIDVQRAVGRISNLEDSLKEAKGTIGMAHTRWATHGKPSVENAHPHSDPSKNLVIVHNGIIENFQPLKNELLKEGAEFLSQTDTEVFAHLIGKFYKGDLEAAVKEAVSKLDGAYACVVMHKDNPEKLVCVRNRSPLILGLGVNENLIASDVPAVLKYTNRVVYLKDMEMATVTKDSVELFSLKTGKAVHLESKEIDWNIEDAQKGGYDHFMLKEIYEQPRSIQSSLLGSVGSSNLEEMVENGIPRIKFIACGTSYHACLTGKYIFENLLKVPSSVEMASEFRYSSPTKETPVVILVTQSGETADTIAAAREAKRRNCFTIGITNVVGSTITREVDEVLYIKSGPEIGVAATKTFTSQLMILYRLAMRLGEYTGTLSPNELKILNTDLKGIPRYVDQVLETSEQIEEIAKDIHRAENMFFIGRNINYPSALEGALKLKEISYIHAEGYPAGELKHGPISLLTSKTPVVAVVVRDGVYEKMLSNVQEVAARSAPVIAVVNEGDDMAAEYADHIISVPKTPVIFSPIPVSVALQLLAYFTARERGCPIDNPRNLAKSVTVE